MSRWTSKKFVILSVRALIIWVVCECSSEHNQKNVIDCISDHFTSLKMFQNAISWLCCVSETTHSKNSRAAIYLRKPGYFLPFPKFSVPSKTRTSNPSTLTGSCHQKYINCWVTGVSPCAQNEIQLLDSYWSRVYDFLLFIVTIFPRVFFSSHQNGVFDDIMLFIIRSHFRASGKFHVKNLNVKPMIFLLSMKYWAE